MVVRTQMYDNRTTDHDSMLNNGTYERIDASDHKIIFRLVAKSHMIDSQHTNQVLKYGGRRTESKTILGKAIGVFMDFKAALTSKNRKARLKAAVNFRMILLNSSSTRKRNFQ